jgi:hypothetical protein
MLALHGIFLLVTRHGLEYPRFYARLYQLLTPEAFHVRRHLCLAGWLPLAAAGGDLRTGCLGHACRPQGPS